MDLKNRISKNVILVVLYYGVTVKCFQILKGNVYKSTCWKREVLLLVTLGKLKYHLISQGCSKTLITYILVRYLTDTCLII